MNALFHTCCERCCNSGACLNHSSRNKLLNETRPFNFQTPVIKMSHIIRVWQGYSFPSFFHFHINFSEGQICRGGGEEPACFCAHRRLKYDLFTVSLIVQNLMVLDGDNLGVNFTLCPKSSHCHCNPSCRLKGIFTT